MDARRLRRRGALWTLTTTAHVVPFVAAGVVLFLVQPLAVAVSLASFAHAWIIPMLYAARGANVAAAQRATRRRRRASAPRWACSATSSATTRATLHARPACVVERGRARHVGRGGGGRRPADRPRAPRATCFCVRVDDPSLPPADRIAHLLLALRADEVGFATVANMAFCGARWRVRRRLPRGDAPGAGAPRRALDRVYDRPSGTSDRRAMGGGPRAAHHAVHDHRHRIPAVEDHPRRRAGRLGSGQDAPAIRRYRLARLHVNDRPSGADRYEHLRRSYD